MKQNKFFYKTIVFMLLMLLSFIGCGSAKKTDVEQGNDFTADKIDLKKLIEPRISVAGSSVSWGSGGKIDDDSYIGYVADKLRTQYATTLTPDQLDSTQQAQSFGSKEPYTFRRSLYKFTGVGTSVSGTLSGDKIYIVFAKERGNKGAALIDLYIDNVLVKTFSTKNNQPHVENKILKFEGDGHTRSWDLEVAHTYNHTVKVNGIMNENGEINSLGYDGKWPDNMDWLIMRKVIADEVHHYLSFKNPPAQGVSVEIQFDACENIKPIKSTSDNTKQNIGTKVESLYGDRTTTNLDNRLHFEEGLDFRQTDDRAVIEADMGDDTLHSFKLVIKGLDPESTGTTPEFFLNYVTNKMYYFQNASIGGFTVKDFLKPSGTTNYQQINAFDPDLVILESSTNDDWEVNEWLAWKDEIMSVDEVRSLPTAIDLQKLEKVSDGRYKVGITKIAIKSRTANSITLDSTAHFESIKEGDILVIGDFKGDNRRVAVRIVKSWDPSTKTASFDKVLNDTDFIGEVCQIRRIDQWVKNVEEFIQKIREHKSTVQIGLITGGIPNLNARRLEGYREKAIEIAKRLNVKYIDIYQATYDFTYDREPQKQLYINANRGTKSTNAREYDLYLDNGKRLEVMLARNFKIYIDGTEIPRENYYIDGGLTKTWPSSGKNRVEEPLYLENAKWIIKPSRLIFVKDVPVANATIEIFYNDNDEYKWSQDDTHLGTNGYKIFSESILKSFF